MLYEDSFPNLPSASDEIACSADGSAQSVVDNTFVQAAHVWVVRVSGSAAGGRVSTGAVSFDSSCSATVAGDAASEAGASLAASPTPVSHAATVTLSVPTAQRMTVAVFDAPGRRVATLHDGVAAAGVLPLDASALSSGVVRRRRDGA